METIELNGHTIRKWQVGASTFLAYPEAGARLMNWFVTLPDGNFRDILYWPEDADLDDISKVRGGNPILFPFCARTYSKGEIGFWTDPEGQKRPMAMHGYARQGHFELDSLHEKGFLARFVPSAEAAEAYPFNYTFTVNYRFEELAVHVDFELHNQDTRPIPWSPGHHFYFNLPWHAGLTRADYQLHAPAKKFFRAQNTDGTLTPVKGIAEPISIADPTIIDLIRTGLKTREVSFGPKGGEEDIIIQIGTNEPPAPWTTLVTWTLAEDSPFYCVEPWMAPPNAAEHGKGLNWVQPDKREVFSVVVRLY